MSDGGAMRDLWTTVRASLGVPNGRNLSNFEDEKKRLVFVLPRGPYPASA